jgi:hypothetical protein
MMNLNCANPWMMTGSRATVLRRLSMLCLLAGLAAGAPALAAAPDVPDNFAPAAAPEQPLPFSHRQHLSFGLQCLMCHANPDPGAQMTFPAAATCLSCHETTASDQPAIVKLQEYAAAGQAVPWVRVYEVTPGVSWSHRVHLDAGAQCETCHGDVSQYDDMAERKATDAMASCIACHQNHGVAARCETCHAWPSDQALGID